MPGIVLKGRGSIAPEPSRPTEGPQPGFFDSVAAGFRTTEDEVSSVQEKRRFDAYIELEDSLFDMGYSYKDTRHPDIGLFGLIGGGNAAANSTPDTDRIWSIVERERARNPAAFAGIAKTRDEFDQQTLRRNGGRDEDQRTLARGSAVGGFIGAIGGSATDTFNVLTLPLGGGGKNVAAAFLREGITNAGLELFQTPTVAQNKAKMGEETTLGEAATNVAAAFAFGATLGGAAKYGADNWGTIKQLPQAAQEAVWGKIAPLLPEKMRGTMEWDAIPDDMLPDLAEGLIGRDSLTPDERTAIEAMRRDIEVRSLNPFVDDPAGSAAHADELAATMQRILNEAGSGAPAPAAIAAPGARPARLTPSALNSGTALRTGTVDTGGRVTLKRRIGIVESGGDNAAANPNSTALGKYQFIKDTWTRLYKARYGSGGLSDAAIAGKRSDPRLQEILMDDLISYNARVLERAGSNGSAGDLYLAHFAGAETAAKLLRADRNAPASSIFSAKAVEANASILRGKSVGEVIAWAHRKMGSDPGPAPRMRAGDADPADPIAAIEAEIADIDRQLAELDGDGGDISSALDDAPLVNPDDLTPAPLDYAGEIPLPKVPVEPGGAPRGQVDEAVDRILPELKRISLDTRQSLNRIDVLARQLDSTEEDVTRALQKLALYGGGGVVMTPGGKFRRMPVRSKPLSILEFVAAGGGLRDVRDPGLGGGESLATVFQQLVKNRTKDGTKLRTQPALVPGFGPLLREGGRTLDEWGEALHEAGYLGTPDERPTVSEVLEALKEEFAGRKIYAQRDLGDALAGEMQPPRGEFGPGNDPLFDDDYSRATWARDLNFDDDELAAIYELWDAARADETIVRDLDELVNDAIDAFIDEQIYAARFDAMMEEAPEAVRYFDDLEEAGYGNAAGADREFAQDPDASGTDGPDAGEAGAIAAAGRGATDAGAAAARSGPLDPDQQGPLDPESFAAWDDPDTGAGVQGQADSLEHDLRMAVEPGVERQATVPAPEGDTRGQGVQYHGARGELPDLSEGYYNPANIYGGFETFYTTDAIDIAGGYKRKNNEGKIYRIDEVEPVQFFDMEQRLDMQEANAIFGLKPDDDEFPGLAIQEVIGDGDGRASLREIMDEIRAQSQGEGYSRDETQGIFDTAIYNLQQQGFGGMQHIGGLLTKNEPHQVKIYFAAQNQLRLTEVSAEKAPADPADMFGGATRDEARQALERRGEGGMSSDAPQKPVGSDGGLFDTGARDQTEFRLEPDGPTMKADQVLKSIDDEQAAIDAMAACLKPRGGDA